MKPNTEVFFVWLCIMCATYVIICVVKAACKCVEILWRREK